MATACSIQRGYDLKRVHHLYDRHEPYGPDICVYCGDPATTRDHVIPVSYLASLGDRLEAHLSRLRSGLVLLPACRDCNTRLHGFVATCMMAKREELKRRLRRRHARLLGSYDWQPEELAGLGYSLRIRIEAMERKRSAILERLAFPRYGEAGLL